MGNSIKDIREAVKTRMKEKSLKALTSRVQKEKLHLWDLKKGSRFISHSVLVALYKDLFGVGYCELRNQVGSRLKITEKSLSNNQKKQKIFL